MKIAFKIPPVKNNTADLHLLIEAGAEDISFVLFSKQPLYIQGFYCYNLNKHIVALEYADTLKNIMKENDVLNQPFASTNIFYNFSTATLVPNAYFIEEEKSNICDAMFGQDKTAYCFDEDVKGKNIKLVYRIPQKIYETLNNLFPKNIFAHSTSAQLNLPNDNGDVLHCLVYHNSIKLMLFVAGEIQLVQYVDYETPADVCYHLLNVCERYKISPTNIELVLSGMIEKSSNLYVEIYKYFLTVSFVPQSTQVNMAKPLEELPSHFYEPLTALAQCV